jgi:hypothetical protein
MRSSTYDFTKKNPMKEKRPMIVPHRRSLELRADFVAWTMVSLGGAKVWLFRERRRG